VDLKIYFAVKIKLNNIYLKFGGKPLLLFMVGGGGFP